VLRCCANPPQLCVDVLEGGGGGFVLFPACCLVALIYWNQVIYYCGLKFCLVFLRIKKMDGEYLPNFRVNNLIVISSFFLWLLWIDVEVCL
jgi:hypothetical protein